MCDDFDFFFYSCAFLMLSLTPQDDPIRQFISSKLNIAQTKQIEPILSSKWARKRKENWYHTLSSSIHIILLVPSSFRSNLYEIELIVFFLLLTVIVWSMILTGNYTKHTKKKVKKKQINTKTWAQIYIVTT